MSYRVGVCKVCGRQIHVHKNGNLRNVCEHVKSVKDVKIVKKRKRWK